MKKRSMIVSNHWKRPSIQLQVWVSVWWMYRWFNTFLWRGRWRRWWFGRGVYTKPQREISCCYRDIFWWRRTCYLRGKSHCKSMLFYSLLITLFSSASLPLPPLPSLLYLLEIRNDILLIRIRVVMTALGIATLPSTVTTTTLSLSLSLPPPPTLLLSLPFSALPLLLRLYTLLLLILPTSVGLPLAPPLQSTLIHPKNLPLPLQSLLPPSTTFKKLNFLHPSHPQLFVRTHQGPLRGLKGACPHLLLRPHLSIKTGTIWSCHLYLPPRSPQSSSSSEEVLELSPPESPASESFMHNFPPLHISPHKPPSATKTSPHNKDPSPSQSPHAEQAISSPLSPPDFSVPQRMENDSHEVHTTTTTTSFDNDRSPSGPHTIVYGFTLHTDLTRFTCAHPARYGSRPTDVITGKFNSFNTP